MLRKELVKRGMDPDMVDKGQVHFSNHGGLMFDLPGKKKAAKLLDPETPPEDED